jgi:hypothetical protein
MSPNNEKQDNFDVCSLCKGICCKNARPPITSKRKKIIETYLKEQSICIENPFFHSAYIFPKEGAEDYCVFYDRKTRKCLIHAVKPETCIAGPITFDINMSKRRIEWFLKREKICALAGILSKNEELLKKHLKSAKKEIFRLINELDSEALKAILKIEEPETFKIDEDKIDKEP